MKHIEEIEELNDRQQIQQLLVELGFTCSSFPTAQNLIYSKDGEVVVIKNKTK
jgi:hypothetical protein